MTAPAQALPPGYSLGRDTDGTWWIEPPENVAFGELEPGEMWMIGDCDEAQALSDALQAIDLYASAL